jgi:uncharacterized membrane protein
MNKNRLETLADGIFAIVMTLLVMTVVVPQREVVIKEIGFEAMVFSKLHDIANYTLSFILLGIFWIEHHQQYHFIKRTDHVHIWINIFTLLFIALFPFSTSLVNEFSDKDIAELIFGFNMFIVGMLFYLNWDYATKNKHLVGDEINDKDIATIRRKCQFIIIIAAIAILLSQAHPAISADIFWLIPVIIVIEHIFKR